MEALRKAKKILSKYPICDFCLGRQFSNLGTGTTNEIRGKIIKEFLTMAYSKNGDNLHFIERLARSGSELAKNLIRKEKGAIITEHETCYICQDELNKKIDKIVELIIKESSEYEYRTFLIGTRLPGEWYEREKELKEEFNLVNTEYLKQEFNRLIGKKLSLVTRVTTDFNTPEIVIEVEPLDEKIKLKVRSLYIKGRYRKYVRTLPQTHWPCRYCKGRGCKHCNFTGKQYPESVEELIAKKAVEMTKAEKGILHGSGREDIDARMLGTGRPFVLELVNPKIRSIELQKLMQKTNEYAQGKIEVLNYEFTTRRELVRLKTKAQLSVKKYRALIEFEKEISDGKLKEIKTYFNNLKIKQRTPKRVAHRRADKVREKIVYSVELTRKTSNTVEAIIVCSGGCYVKELISGDEGRTKPSISDVAGINGKCIELDVLEIRDNQP